MTIQVQSNNAEADAVVNKPASASTEASKGENPSAPEAKAPEQKESEHSESTETEAVEGETTETEGSTQEGHEESGENTETENKDDKAGKKKGGFQRRIDKLNAQKAAAQQEVEYWKQQALKGASEAKPDLQLDSKPVKAEGEPDPNKFESHLEFVKALTRWEAKQIQKESEQEQERKRSQSEQSKVETTNAERMKAFAEKHPDFHELIEDNLRDVPKNPAIESIIKTSENGPELLYELAKNKEEAKRIAKLPPFAVAREIGKIEERLASKASAPKQETKKASSAPRPIGPVGGGGKASAPAKTLEEAAASGDYQSFKRISRELEKQKRRRA